MAVNREDLYLSEAWFDGGKVGSDVRLARRKMVTTRKARVCSGNEAPHEMPAGSRMLVETAIFDGAWASWALCTNCMDNWLRQIGEIDEERAAKEADDR